MTSSLVGSEMCIRDSVNDVQKSSALDTPSPPSSQFRIGGAKVVKTWCAVSYTHLTLPTICSV
eukprot:9745021-Prorocentrum_lima.AAC.1